MRLFLPCLLLFLLPAVGAEQKHKPRINKTVTVMTGCLDEAPGELFVLLDELEMKRVAELQPSGFPNTGFARYLGHKVRVSGQKNGVRLKVSKITSLSDVCPTPAPESR
jgi:hypothetical protein